MLVEKFALDEPIETHSVSVPAIDVSDGMGIYTLAISDASVFDIAAVADYAEALNLCAERKIVSHHLIGQRRSEITSSAGITLSAEAFPSRLAVGSCIVVCAGSRPLDLVERSTICWLQRQYLAGCTICAVGSGTLVLARAGLLEGTEFAVSPTLRPIFHELFPSLTPLVADFVCSNRILTCAGGISTMRMLLRHLVDQIDGIAVLGETIFSTLAVPRQQPGPRADRDGMAESHRHSTVARAISKIHANLEEPLEVDELLLSEGMTRRTFERTFRRRTGASPKQYYQHARLYHARGLLRETDLSVGEVALAAGFTTSQHLARVFRAKLGRSPLEYRRDAVRRLNDVERS